MIRLASPDIHDSDIDRCVEVIRSGNLVQGQNVEDLEQALCSFTQLTAAAVVSSGTAALHLVLRALKIGPGDTVIVPAFTFPATANVVENLGAKTLLCDVDENSYVVTPAEIEKTIRANQDKSIKAIMVVHEFGYPALVADIRKLADDHGLYLIEDAACALGTSANDKHVGYYSHAACFSFHPRKAITTGEGGAVISNDSGLIESIRKFRNHGIAVDNGVVDFEVAGLNYRMTDFQAALAIGQLERFDQEIVARKKLAAVYQNNLANISRVTLPHVHDGHSWQSFMLVLNKDIERKQLIGMLREKNIETNLGAQALHVLAYYRDRYAFAPDDLPNALRLYQSGLVLPLYGKLDVADIEYVSETISGLLQS